MTLMDSVHSICSVILSLQTLSGLRIASYSTALASWRSRAALGRDGALHSGAVQCRGCSCPNSGRESTTILFFQKCVADLPHLAACVWPSSVVCGRSAVVRPPVLQLLPLSRVAEAADTFLFWVEEKIVEFCEEVAAEWFMGERE
ncbi:hypothetical protein E2542_SST09737 [Spatholobus suberectus]|nr:hypothetical protein E2542_SST09737 [Spatholobus suberectus]